MRKLFTILLLCLFLVLFLLVGRGEAYDLQTYVNTDTDGQVSDTAVSTSTIIPGKCWILAVRVSPDRGSVSCKEPYVKLYDAATTAAMSTSTIFDQFETPTGNQLTSDTVVYPGGKKLANGLAIRQGGYTTVTVLYERRIR